MQSNVQETSITAFRELVESGQQHTKQQEVLQGVREHPSSTANEVYEYMRTQYGINLRYDSNTRARFTELRDKGLVKNSGKRPCQVTGKLCLIWDPA